MWFKPLKRTSIISAIKSSKISYSSQKNKKSTLILSIGILQLLVFLSCTQQQPSPDENKGPSTTPESPLGTDSQPDSQPASQPDSETEKDADPHRSQRQNEKKEIFSLNLDEIKRQPCMNLPQLFEKIKSMADSVQFNATLYTESIEFTPSPFKDEKLANRDTLHQQQEGHPQIRPAFASLATFNNFQARNIDKNDLTELIPKVQQRDCYDVTFESQSPYSNFGTIETKNDPMTLKIGSHEMATQNSMATPTWIEIQILSPKEILLRESITVLDTCPPFAQANMIKTSKLTWQEGAPIRVATQTMRNLLGALNPPPLELSDLVYGRSNSWIDLTLNQTMPVLSQRADSRIWKCPFLEKMNHSN